jgi:hypothetical protein
VFDVAEFTGLPVFSLKQLMQLQQQAATSTSAATCT